MSCWVCPTLTLAEAGLTVTDATGAAVTATATVPLCPSDVADTVAAPAATPLTSPLLLMLAAPGLVEAHVTTRPLNGLPPASSGVAVSCTVCPATTLTAAELMTTIATGAGVTVTTAVSADPPPLTTTLTLPVSEPAL